MITVTFTDTEKELTKTYGFEEFDDITNPEKLSRALKGKTVRNPLQWAVENTKRVFYDER